MALRQILSPLQCARCVYRTSFFGHAAPRRHINFFSKGSFPKGEQNELKLALLGDPVLRQRSENVCFDSGVAAALEWLRPLSRDMAHVMHAQYGAGLSAPQVGRSLRLFLMDDSDPDDPNAPQVDPVLVINPKIIRLDGETEFDFEGCLSVPLLAALVPRATSAHVSYIDFNGNLVRRELRGWAARVFQHEVDHLNGVMFLDRVVAPQHIVMESQLVAADSTLDVASVLALKSSPFEKTSKQLNASAKSSSIRKRV